MWLSPWAVEAATRRALMGRPLRPGRQGPATGPWPARLFDRRLASVPRAMTAKAACHCDAVVAAGGAATPVTHGLPLGEISSLRYRESFLGRLVSARYVILAKSPMAATAVSERWKLQCDHWSVDQETFRDANLYLMKIPRMHRFSLSILTVDEKRRFEVRLSKSTKIDQAYVASRPL